MKKNYCKIVFSDIDGTLLNSKHQIPENTRKKIKNKSKRYADCCKPDSVLRPAADGQSSVCATRTRGS